MGFLFQWYIIKPGAGYHVLYRIFEIDDNLYLAHTLNDRDFYGRNEPNEFYMSKQRGKWISDPENDQSIVDDIGQAIDQWLSFL
jgi:hypothetical protein